MADTIAVMNGGHIEQLGGPTELYESPNTTFVANFLGQSNLVHASVSGTDGDNLVLEVQGQKVAMPAARRTSGDDDLLIGVRPEKIHLVRPEDDASEAGRNVLPGGVVTDASFTGVSTQYLVRMPWGQELQVFEQNTGRRRIFRVGDKVELSWRPEYAFLLDHEQDASAGSQLDDE